MRVQRYTTPLPCEQREKREERASVGGRVRTEEEWRGGRAGR